MTFLLFLLLMVCPASLNADWTYVPFDDAMKKNDFSEQIYIITTKIIGIDGHLLYDFFKDNFKTNSALCPGPELLIPKIIHQIWLGSEVPESFKALQQSW